MAITAGVSVTADSTAPVTSNALLQPSQDTKSTPVSIDPLIATTTVAPANTTAAPADRAVPATASDTGNPVASSLRCLLTRNSV
jgi:hypothetical protein